MSNVAERELGFLVGCGGERVLTGRSFSDTIFGDFTIGPARGRKPPLSITNCAFTNCRVDPGTCVIYPGTELRDVTFDTVLGNDLFTIYAEGHYERVKIAGTLRASGLWIKPDYDCEPEVRRWAEESMRAVSTAFDISAFEAPDVSVLGISPEKVIRNPKRHAIVRLSMKDEIPWDEFDQSTPSFWSSCLRYLRIHDVQEGIFGLPDSTEAAYDRVMTERDRLGELGIET